jgi:hypothetical protein
LDPSDGDGRSLALNIDADGNFRNVSVTPGAYFIRVMGVMGSGPIGGPSAAAEQAWTLKSSIANGRNVADVPLMFDRDVDNVVVTFTDRPASLTGTVRTSQGTTDPAAAVILFPVDEAMWTRVGNAPRHLRSVRTDRLGAFRLTGLPAGEYFIIAIADAVAAEWQDPKFLVTAARQATRVKINEGQTTTLDLRTQRW